MLEFLSEKFYKPIMRLNILNVEEIRLRVGCAAVVKAFGKYSYLSSFGCSEELEKAISFTEKDKDELFSSLTEKSVYAFKEQIARGFISNGGVRTGIGGRCVTVNENVEYITDFTSFNIRIPHRVEGAANELLNYYSDGIENTLVLSLPGNGKTTFVRDIAENISASKRKNVLIADERGEIFPLIKNKNFIDCISFSPKKYAFENGIRSLAPDVIVTDEIFGERDYFAIENAVRSGVKVIATAHADSIDDFFSFKENCRMKELFSYFVLIEYENGKRKIKIERNNLCGR